MKTKIISIFTIILSILILTVGCNQKSDTSTEAKSSNNTEVNKQSETNTEDADNSLEDIKSKGKFVMGMDSSFPPLGFKDDDGNIVGFDVDLAKEVAKRIDVELEPKPIDWNTKEMSLRGKQIDVIWNGFTVTEERKKQILFSDSYLNNSQIIIVKKNSDIDKIEDLEGKTLAVQLDSSASTAVEDSEILDKLKELKKYNDNVQALIDLKVGRVDAVVVDEIMGLYYIKDKDEYKVASDNFGTEEYAIGFRTSDVKFRDAVNEALKDMIEDGTAAKISEKWFDKDIIKK